MNPVNFILALICLTTVSLQNGAKFSHLQSDLLKLLEIKEKPSMSRGRSKVPKYVMDLYKEKAHTSGFTKEGKSAPGKTIRTFFRDTRVSDDEHRFVFNLSALQAKEKIQKAELRIFKRRSKLETTRGYFQVTVNRLHRRAVDGGGSRKRKQTVLVDTKLVKCRRIGEWIVLNVTTAVAFWRSRPSRNFGLWITVTGLGVPQSDFNIATGGRKEPILIVYGVNGEKNNHRSLKNANKISNETRDTYKQDARWKGKTSSFASARSGRSVYEERCARRKLFVKFRDLKWDKWIIAPRGFNAFFCMGTCPEIMDRFFNPTNHAIIQNILHHRYNKKIPQARCVPTSLHSMNMVHFEIDGSIVLKEYSNMVASTCGCR